MLRKLEYAIQVASKKIEELEEIVQGTYENLYVMSKGKSSQKSTPNAKTTEKHS